MNIDTILEAINKILKQLEPYPEDNDLAEKAYGDFKLIRTYNAGFRRGAFHAIRMIKANLHSEIPK